MLAAGVQESAPDWFNAIYKACEQSKFTAQWTLKEFESSILNTHQSYMDQDMPIISLNDMVNLFEMLDKDQDGVLTKSDLTSFLQSQQVTRA